MGTLDTALTNIRLRIKEDRVQYFSNSNLISLINSNLFRAFNLMKGHECKMIMNVNEITLVEGQTQYVIADYYGIVDNMVFSSDGTEIPRCSEFCPDAFSWQEYASGIEIHNGTPGQDIVVYSYQQPPVTTLTGLATADMPWWGIWTDAIVKAVVVECQEIRERDNSRTAAMAAEAEEHALYTAIERYGVIARQMRGTLNV